LKLEEVREETVENLASELAISASQHDENQSPMVRVYHSRSTNEIKSANLNSAGTRTLRIIRGNLIEELTIHSQRSQEEVKHESEFITSEHASLHLQSCRNSQPEVDFNQPSAVTPFSSLHGSANFTKNNVDVARDNQNTGAVINMHIDGTENPRSFWKTQSEPQRN
jgi:hypothetical protein